MQCTVFCFLFLLLFLPNIAHSFQSDDINDEIGSGAEYLIEHRTIENKNTLDFVFEENYRNSSSLNQQTNDDKNQFLVITVLTALSLVNFALILGIVWLWLKNKQVEEEITDLRIPSVSEIDGDKPKDAFLFQPVDEKMTEMEEDE